MNWLAHLSGLKADISISEDDMDVVFSATETEAYKMLACGVTLTRHDWQELSDLQRDAFLCAANKFHAEQAVRHALAASGQQGMLKVVSEIDGGETEAVANLNAAANKAAARIAKGIS